MEEASWKNRNEKRVYRYAAKHLVRSSSSFGSKWGIDDRGCSKGMSSQYTSLVFIATYSIQDQIRRNTTEMCSYYTLPMVDLQSTKIQTA